MKTVKQLLEENKIAKGLVPKFAHVANYIGFKFDKPEDIVIEKLRMRLFEYIDSKKLSRIADSLEQSHFNILSTISEIPKCSRATGRAIADLMLPNQKSNYQYSYMNSIKSGKL